MSAQKAISFEADAYRRALEESDADTLIAMFTDDAEMEMFDKRTPPGSPAVWHGKDAIAPVVRELCEREMRHEILQVVSDGDHVAYTERCVYPEGNMVMSSTMMDLRDGGIAHQVTVQAWDEEESDRVQVGDFDASETRESFDHGHAEMVRIGGHNVVRTTMEPGWRWSEHMRERAGTDLCELTHTVLLLSGTLRVRPEDGAEEEVTAGCTAFVPPRHDAWVVGDEPVVAIDWTGKD
ncbi:nuclear transport factor 2 family protein [Nocardiopsis lambiniae]|uniref:Nuclear transport factor 2 family protein n=1 Tax=Nocardiopsis lambiniae TaxID=3075539 RepID=A0ABU2M9Q7_9ACTN|nr:nuclear transport factor 2 family protein [Nocardiopsis sp. DSM 44743]MDT0329402.1 nuclear transport factor 2 family protein [Nocardiopsis sp. DSM 44743]